PGEEACLGVVAGEGFEKLRSEKAWASLQAFQNAPGNKCPECWLTRQHCCCAGIPQTQLRLKVYVLMHHVELSQRRASNTAKLLLQFGAELLAWGVQEHDERLERLISEDLEGTVVLFPSKDAVQARELGAQAAMQVRQVVVLDGGWRETSRMNNGISPEVVRCVVDSASRAELGGTRKYAGGCDGHVQTAAAFVTLLRELGEEESEISAVRDGLAHFLSCYEAQINRSKT
ncbi:unnamed protein product, partial [Polarella glacialis]